MYGSEAYIPIQKLILLAEGKYWGEFQRSIIAIHCKGAGCAVNVP